MTSFCTTPPRMMALNEPIYLAFVAAQFQLETSRFNYTYMMNRRKMMMALGGLVATALMSGCVVRPYGGVEVVTPASVPAPSVQMYPDSYVWDGYEYVGIVGSQYYYLGPGHVWIPCEPFRVARFQDWARHHSHWRAHAVHNGRYSYGHGKHKGRDNHRDHGHHPNGDEH